MPKNRIVIISLAALVALIPFLGFPRSWESVIQVSAGLSIIGLSVWIQIDRKLSHKAKARVRQERRKLIDRRISDQGEASSSETEVGSPDYFEEKPLV